MSSKNDAFLHEAVAAHVKWKTRLRNFSMGKEQVNPEAVCKDNQCALGKWIYGEGGTECGKYSEFEKLRHEHANFHVQAGTLAHKIADGHNEVAEDELNDDKSAFNAASRQTIAAINALKQTMQGSMRGLSRYTMKTKLVLILSIPVLFLLAYGALSIEAIYSRHQAYETTAGNMEMAVAVGNLVHMMQIERGATSGFLQSRGAKFSTEMQTARANSDRAAAQLQEKLGSSGTLPAAVAEPLGKARKDFDALRAAREAVNAQSVAGPAAVGAYTRNIAGFLSVLPAISGMSRDPELARMLTAFTALAQGKEAAGRERAALTGALSANAFPAQTLRDWSILVGEQRLGFGLFQAMAPQAFQSALGEVHESAAGKKVQEMRDAVIAGNVTFTPEQWFATSTERINSLRKIEEGLGSLVVGEAHARSSEATRLLLINLAAFVAVLTCVGLCTFIFLRNIHRRLSGFTADIQGIESSGDLSRRINVTAADEIGKAGNAFNALMDSFENVLGDMFHAARLVARNAENLAVASDDVKAAASNQSEAASSMAASIEEMSVSISMVADHASETERLSSDARHESSQGRGVVSNAASSMNRIAAAVATSADDIQRLSQRTHQISGIVEVIEDIAGQTNLLALNAAIEAARAGEQGRGFAVVADEVRKLAERTTQATSEIADVIGAIQRETDVVVQSMVTCKDQADNGSHLAKEAETALDHIGNKVDDTAARVTEIATAAREQGVATQTIAGNVERVAEMVERNNETVGSIAGASRRLEQLSAQMLRSAERFKM